MQPPRIRSTFQAAHSFQHRTQQSPALGELWWKDQDAGKAVSSPCNLIGPRASVQLSAANSGRSGAQSCLAVSNNWELASGNVPRYPYFSLSLPLSPLFRTHNAPVHLPHSSLLRVCRPPLPLPLFSAPSSPPTSNSSPTCPCLDHHHHPRPKFLSSRSHLWRHRLRQHRHSHSIHPAGKFLCPSRRPSPSIVQSRIAVTCTHDFRPRSPRDRPQQLCAT